jgi:large subunit ribosomal protein L17
VQRLDRVHEGRAADLQRRPQDSRCQARSNREATKLAATGPAAAKPAAAEPVAAEPVQAFAETDVVADEWAGSAQPTADGEAPAGYDIKGNKNSMLYHTPGSRFYKQTVAEVWFDSEESAEAAGFSKPASQQAAEAAEAGFKALDDETTESE